MVLEATFIVIDNSDYMRNGDFAPSRLEAQQDAVNLLAGAKTQSNPENTVGVLTMAGKGVEVRVAMTSDVGKVLSQTHGAKVGGEINLSAGLQVAGLALKHRQNKNQRQRIVVFVGSPVREDEKDLVKLGKTIDPRAHTCPRPTRTRMPIRSASQAHPMLIAARAHPERRKEAQEELGRGRHSQLWRGGREHAQARGAAQRGAY